MSTGILPSFINKEIKNVSSIVVQGKCYLYKSLYSNSADFHLVCERKQENNDAK